MNKISKYELIDYIKCNSSACLCISVLTAVLFVVYRMIPPVMDLWAGYTYYNDAGGGASVFTDYACYISNLQWKNSIELC